MPPSQISVSIVSYNTRELLWQCLRTLFERARAEDLSIEVFVADNGSRDGSISMVRDQFSAVNLIEIGENVGFGRANNRALKEARGAAFLLLNSDAFLGAGALTALWEELQNDESLGAIGPQLLFPDGSAQTSWGNDPRAGDILSEQFFLGALNFAALRARFGGGTGDVAGGEAPRLVEQISAACELVRAAAYREIGGFDENFWMYVEDVDLNVRLRRAGWQIAHVPGARVTHHIGGSSGHWRDRARMVAAFNWSRIYFFGRYDGLDTAHRLRRQMIGGALLRLTGWTLAASLGRRGARDKVRLFRHVFARDNRDSRAQFLGLIGGAQRRAIPGRITAITQR